MVNTIKPDLDDKKDAEHDFNLDFDIRLNMARAMVKETPHSIQSRRNMVKYSHG